MVLERGDGGGDERSAKRRIGAYSLYVTIRLCRGSDVSPPYTRSNKKRRDLLISHAFLIAICNQSAFLFTAPFLKHLVQTYCLDTVPFSSTTETFWIFAFQWVGALRLLWLTVLPLILPFPQTLQTLDIYLYLP